MARKEGQYALTHKHRGLETQCALLRQSMLSWRLWCAQERQCAEDQGVLVCMALRCWHQVGVRTARCRATQQSHDALLVLFSCLALSPSFMRATTCRCLWCCSLGLLFPDVSYACLEAR